MSQDDLNALHAEMVVLEEQLDGRCPFCQGFGSTYEFGYTDDGEEIPYLSVECDKCNGSGDNEHWLYTIPCGESLSETAENMVKLANWKGWTVGLFSPNVVISPGESVEDALRKLQETEITTS